MGSYVPNTLDERKTMLNEIGYESIDDLFRHIPEQVKIQGGLDIPEGMSEMEVLKKMKEIAKKNKVFPTIFRGAGAVSYTHLDVYKRQIPYAMVNEESPVYRDSIYRARAVVRERLRLAMGLSLRPENKPVHLTAGVEASNISDKYYEPPLMQVIPSACAACEERGYEVSNMCKGCLAHPCMEVCPKRCV